MEIGFLVILSTEESQGLGQNKHFTSTAASKIQQCDQNITLHKHIRSMDQNGAWILNRISVTTKVTCKSLQLSALVVEYPGGCTNELSDSFLRMAQDHTKDQTFFL